MQTVARLIQTFTPTHYNLSLTIEREQRIFNGTVTIEGISSGNEIRLHAKDLTIDSTVIDGHSATAIQADNDELVIAQDGLTAGAHIVAIGFSGTITDGMHGLYPCYFDHNGIKKELLATQFESHHAREVFPCIDEPEAKATFDVTLTTEHGITVLGNMPIKQQVVENKKLVTRFETTPRMSSYLLAWVTGELHKKSAVTDRGVKVNVWATVAQPAASLDFAVDIATRTIDFYEDYFGVDYPLAKCDHVALPDFSSGAMENWGLITYREVALLADPKTSGVSSKHFIATVIAHELAHQWFGNLVTMKWWDDLWLNESFADFVEHIAVDALHPEWDTWLDFILSRGIAALRRDAIDGVQSVHVDVRHPDEITTLFDGAIVYGKGARLMKMLRSFVGEDAFRHGLSDYFKKFAYQNTDGDDLWQALSDASGKDVASFMHAWITQPGYPVLQVKTDSLSQTQFFIGEHSPSTKLWPILLSPQPSNNLPVILDEFTVKLPIYPDQRFNIDDTGHFVTRYPSEHLHGLLEHVSDFSTIDRLTLLNDQSLLVRGRYEPSTVLIDLLEHYESETNDAVWSIMSLTLGELKKFVETDETAEKKLKTLSREVAQKEFDRLGFDETNDEPITDTKLRAIVLSMMLYSEDQVAIDRALRRFHITKLLELPAETRSLIMSAAVRFGDDRQIVDKLMEIYVKTPSAELREDIASAVTSTRSLATAKKLLRDCLNPEIIRPQDVTPWFIYLLRNRHTREVAWTWLRDNWQWVVDTFGGDKSYDEFPRYAASGLMTNKQFSEYKAFFEPMLTELSLKRAITMGISDISARLELMDEDGPAVREALRAL